jgi:HSP20 family molecular chaperone IbpA
MGRTRNPFRGLMDHMSEMARMREYAEGGGQEDQRRTHATAWVPTADIFAKGDDLVIRCELAGVEQEDVEISLSEGIDGSRISADFENGLLEVTVQGGADHPEPERIHIGSRTS